APIALNSSLSVSLFFNHYLELKNSCKGTKSFRNLASSPAIFFHYLLLLRLLFPEITWFRP
ncbi:MAG: hypothetical protein J6T22_12590, partial [Bacteroidales bacterium]|nr:hypothetical protein [Bacteroidales bacterium]